MKKGFSIFWGCMLIVVTAFAQEKTAEAKARLKTESLSNALKLSPAQVNTISTLHATVYKKLDEAKKQCGDDKDCYKKKKKALKNEREQTYKKIFTAEQFKQYVMLEAQEDDKKEKEKQTQKSSNKK